MISELKQMLSDIHSLDTSGERISEPIMECLLHVANSQPLEKTGSLLKSHLSVAAVQHEILSLLLVGATNEDIEQYLSLQADIQDRKRPMTLKSAWYNACKTIATTAHVAVADAMSRPIPLDVKELNMRSGQPDVMDLPLELATLVHGLLNEAERHEARDKLATNTLMATLSLLGYSQSIQVVGPELLTGWKNFATELIGATSLYVLGMCPVGKYPMDVMNKRQEALT